jgi:predicted SAM-dependent methyltransferase
MTTLHGKEVKVGDLVWDILTGWNKVTNIEDYTIETKNTSYTSVGFSFKEQRFQHLFWQSFEIPAHAFEKPKVKVKKYQVLFEINGSYFTTANWRGNNYFASKEDFEADNNSADLKFISLILKSEIEVEE